VGAGVGADVGAGVGAEVGSAVGEGVGACVGADVGAGVGAAVGGGFVSYVPRLTGSMPEADAMLFSLSLPSCPYRPLPQHLTLLSSIMAHVRSSPADTYLAVLPAPSSANGSASPMVPAACPCCWLFPIPSSPYVLSPQHLSLLLLSTAHACLDPADTCLAVMPVPRFTVGKPSPSSPTELPPLLAVSCSPSCP
jgi:hypothetical protein